MWTSTPRKVHGAGGQIACEGPGPLVDDPLKTTRRKKQDHFGRDKSGPLHFSGPSWTQPAQAQKADPISKKKPLETMAGF